MKSRPTSLTSDSPVARRILWAILWALAGYLNLCAFSGRVWL